MSDVYVLGIDMMKFGRFPNMTVPQLGAQAALMALDDAGLTIAQIESVYCANVGLANAMVGQRILREIGQTGVPVVNCANACASQRRRRTRWQGLDPPTSTCANCTTASRQRRSSTMRTSVCAETARAGR